jgi:hypothetical protein
MTDYKDLKNYSLQQVENFLHDAMSTDATAQEIYDVIRGVVEDNYNVYETAAAKSYDLLALLKGDEDPPQKAKIVIPPSSTCDKDDLSEDCKKNWRDFWTSNVETAYTDEEIDAMCTAAEEKKKTWTVPIEEDDLGEYVINLPDELIEQVGWQENDVLEWFDNNDGSFSLKKVVK